MLDSLHNYGVEGFEKVPTFSYRWLPLSYLTEYLVTVPPGYCYME